MLNGIAGQEDSDWEYSLSTTDHNHYKGIHRSDDSIAATSISSLCARCHSNFHNDSVGTDTGTASAGNFVSPWLRHPIDIDMNIGLGADFGYGAGYQVQTPVGSETIPDGTPSTVDTDGSDKDAIITCITCHRAHGSPNHYSLRWDYMNWPAPGSYNGCFDCHSTMN